MNICLRHRRNNSNNETNRNSTNKQLKKDINDISNKYFLCELCGVLIDGKEEVILNNPN